MAKRTLKIWLKNNPLSKDPNDKTAVLSSVGSINLDDLLDEIVTEGIGIERDMMKNVVARVFNKVKDKTFAGYNVNLGLMYVRAMVKGPFYGKRWDPGVNWIQINITPGAEWWNDLSDIAIEIQGEQSDPIELYSVTDSTTGKTDGTLTKRRNVELKGSYIKLTGDNPAVGVILRNITTRAETRLAPEDIVLNEPSRLLILVPATLDAGDYELTLTTQFTSSDKLLKEPRSVTLGIPLIIG